MTVCSMRNTECNCLPHQCKAAPVVATEASIFTASNRMLLAIIAFGVIVSLIVGIAIQLHNAEIKAIQQERV